MATIIEPRSAAVEPLADLVYELGDIPRERIRLRPPPGTATEKDVVEAEARDKRLCELVDGVLVEKPMGFLESRLALVLGYYLEAFRDTHDLGITAGESGMMRLHPGLVRIPDISFVRWERLPDRKTPREPIAGLAPDWAVEILSRSNTRREMDRKVREYFSAGTRLVWLVDPRARTVQVFTAVDHCLTIDEDGTLDGGDVLPGFTLRLREWFARAEG